MRASCRIRCSRLGPGRRGVGGCGGGSGGLGWWRTSGMPVEGRWLVFCLGLKCGILVVRIVVGDHVSFMRSVAILLANRITL